MRFILSFQCDRPLLLPRAHHNMLEGLVYNLLSIDEEYSEFMHNRGYIACGNSYKLFTFGPLKGPHSVMNNMIAFQNTVLWELRSPDPHFCKVLGESLTSRKSCRIGSSEVELADCCIEESPVFGEVERIKMISPIVLSHSADSEGGKRYIYHNPLEDRYSEYANGNFRRKFQAAYGQEPPWDIHLEALKVGMSDKCVTCYKGKRNIVGWKGVYKLSGDPFAIRFLYETGLGAKNSIGFGMFESYDAAK